jgi:hypothetical protein
VTPIPLVGRGVRRPESFWQPGPNGGDQLRPIPHGPERQSRRLPTSPSSPLTRRYGASSPGGPLAVVVVVGSVVVVVGAVVVVGGSVVGGLVLVVGTSVVDGRVAVVPAPGHVVAVPPKRVVAVFPNGAGRMVSSDRVTDTEALDRFVVALQCSRAGPRSATGAASTRGSSPLWFTHAKPMATAKTIAARTVSTTER